MSLPVCLHCGCYANLGVEEQVAQDEGAQEACGSRQQHTRLVPPVTILHGTPERPQLDVHAQHGLVVFLDFLHEVQLRGQESVCVSHQSISPPNVQDPGHCGYGRMNKQILHSQLYSKHFTNP